MGRIKRRMAVGAAVVWIAALIAACGAASSSSTGKLGRSRAAAGAHILPSPFTILTRYSPKSLGLDRPEALAIGPDGDLYVTDASQRVTVVSPAGKVLRRWGGPGSRPGEFQFTSEDPTDPQSINAPIAVGSNGLVYVSDGGNVRVEVFTAQGRFVRQFGSFGVKPGQFMYPSDLAVDRSGDVYVVDDQNVGVVNKFSPSGKLVWQIGGASSPDPDLNTHHHLTSIDSHGRLVMVSDDVGRVMYVDTDGHKVDAFNVTPGVFRAQVTGRAQGCAVTVDALGNTFVTGCVPGTPTLVYDRTHRLVAEWPGSRYALKKSPSFGPHGEVFALAWDGSLLKLHMTLSGQ